MGDYVNSNKKSKKILQLCIIVSRLVCLGSRLWENQFRVFVSHLENLKKIKMGDYVNSNKKSKKILQLCIIVSRLVCLGSRLWENQFRVFVSHLENYEKSKWVTM